MEERQSRLAGFCLRVDVVGRPFGECRSCSEFEI